MFVCSNNATDDGLTSAHKKYAYFHNILYFQIIRKKMDPVTRGLRNEKIKEMVLHMLALNDMKEKDIAMYIKEHKLRLTVLL